MAASFLHVAKGAASGAAPTITITSTTAGSFLVAAGSYDSTSTGLPAISGGGTWGPYVISPTLLHAGQKDWINYCPVVTAGTTIIQITYSGGSPAFGDIYVWEFGGLINPVPDKAVSATGNSAAPASGTTGTLSSADQVAVGYAESANAVTASGAGWVDDGVEASLSSWGEHQVVTANTALNATFTSVSASWGALCATFMAAPASGFTGPASVFGGFGSVINTVKAVGY